MHHEMRPNDTRPSGARLEWRQDRDGSARVSDDYLLAVADTPQ
jgi:hypothetical protein